jgi:hypothetical protein
MVLQAELGVEPGCALRQLLGDACAASSPAEAGLSPGPAGTVTAAG